MRGKYRLAGARNRPAAVTTGLPAAVERANPRVARLRPPTSRITVTPLAAYSAKRVAPYSTSARNGPCSSLATVGCACASTSPARAYRPGSSSCSPVPETTRSPAKPSRKAPENVHATEERYSSHVFSDNSKKYHAAGRRLGAGAPAKTSLCHRQVKAAHERSKGRYGSPRVHAQLRAEGLRHSRKRVARLMRAQGLQGRAAKRWKKTTIADAAAARADRIRRDFTADASKLNTRWCGDITYIPTWEGWLYLATVIDIASRRVVGYAMADHLRTELAEFFLPVSMITRASRFAGDELRTENMLLGMDRSQFIERLSYHYEQFNYIHPFREGNGRRNSATSAHCNRCSTRS